MRHIPHGSGFAILHVILGFAGVMIGLALITAVILVVLRRRSGARHRPVPAPPALQILDERLARGEIDIQDYQARRQALVDADPTRRPEPPTTP